MLGKRGKSSLYVGLITIDWKEQLEVMSRNKGILALCGAMLVMLFLLPGCAAMATSPVTGFIYSDVAGPLSVAGELEENMLVGRASVKSILGLFASGDASIQTAARSAGITDIRSIDYESTNILGIFAEFTTVVYGTGPGIGGTSQYDTAISGASGSPEAALQVIEYNGMEWTIGPDQNTSWSAADEWVTILGDDWRLPTFAELQNLYSSGISANAWGPFENSGGFVWSSHTDNGVATNFNFVYGQERLNARNYADNGRGFAVRSR